MWECLVPFSNYLRSAYIKLTPLSRHFCPILFIPNAVQLFAHISGLICFPTDGSWLMHRHCTICQKRFHRSHFNWHPSICCHKEECQSIIIIRDTTYSCRHSCSVHDVWSNKTFWTIFVYVMTVGWIMIMNSTPNGDLSKMYVLMISQTKHRYSISQADAWTNVNSGLLPTKLIIILKLF